MTPTGHCFRKLSEVDCVLSLLDTADNLVAHSFGQREEPRSRYYKYEAPKS